MDALCTRVEGIGNEFLDSLIGARVKTFGEQFDNSITETDFNIVGLIPDSRKCRFIGHKSTAACPVWILTSQGLLRIRKPRTLEQKRHLAGNPIAAPRAFRYLIEA